MKKLLVGALALGAMSSFASTKVDNYRCFSSQTQDRGVVELSLDSNDEYFVDLSRYKTSYELRVDSLTPYSKEQVKVKVKNSKKVAQIKIKATYDYVTQKLNLKLNKSTLKATLIFKHYDLWGLVPSTYEKDVLGCEKI